jgi:hypothetical protein
VNLTLRGLADPRFAELGDLCRAHQLPLAVEVALAEAIADPMGYDDANARAVRVGASLVLDNVPALAFAIATPQLLPAKALKIEWSPRITHLGEPERARLDRALAEIEPERLILHRTESEAAMRWGLARGIRRFQGRHIDAMLAATRMLGCEFASGCTIRQCAERASAVSPSGRRGCRAPALLDTAREHRAAAQIAA